jgi:hypothetical protein
MDAVAILTLIVQGLPQVEAAAEAIIKLAQGQSLSPDDVGKLLAAMDAAHRRAQGQPAADVPAAS